MRALALILFLAVSARAESGKAIPPVNEVDTPEQIRRAFRRLAEAVLPRSGGDENFYIDVSAERIGIGTNAPASKLEVNGGDVYVNQTSGRLIMKSPDGTCSSCGPNNADVWSCAGITCP